MSKIEYATNIGMVNLSLVSILHSHMPNSITSAVKEILFNTAASEIERDGCVSTSALAKIMLGIGNRNIIFKNNFSANYIHESRTMIYRNHITGERIVEKVLPPTEHLVEIAKTKLLRVINSHRLTNDQQKIDQSLPMKIKKSHYCGKLRRSARLASRTLDTMQQVHKRTHLAHK